MDVYFKKNIFPYFQCQRGGLPYQKLTVPEHSPPGSVVGNITRAVDADEGSNAIVFYFIAGDTVFCKCINIIHFNMKGIALTHQGNFQ